MIACIGHPSLGLASFSLLYLTAIYLQSHRRYTAVVRRLASYEYDTISSSNSCTMYYLYKSLIEVTSLFHTVSMHCAMQPVLDRKLGSFDGKRTAFDAFTWVQRGPTQVGRLACSFARLRTTFCRTGVFAFGRLAIVSARGRTEAGTITFLAHCHHCHHCPATCAHDYPSAHAPLNTNAGWTHNFLHETCTHCPFLPHSVLEHSTTTSICNYCTRDVRTLSISSPPQAVGRLARYARRVSCTHDSFTLLALFNARVY